MSTSPAPSRYFEIFSAETEAAIAPAFRQHLPQVRDKLEQYLINNGVNASSLAEASHTGLLQGFMGKATPSKTVGSFTITSPAKNPLLRGRFILEEYQDLPLLMGLTHEGGNLSALIHDGDDNPQGFNFDSLLKRVHSLSPQQFISTSGLLPGPKSNQMYRDFLRQVIDEASTRKLEIDPLIDSRHNQPWRENVKTLTGLPMNNATVMLNSRLIDIVKTPPEQFDLEEYRHLVKSQCPRKSRINDYALGRLFFTDAFALLETCADHALAIRVLKAKALVWAERFEFDATTTADLAEQLLACALFTHPEQFKKAGCGFRNLLGFQTGHALAKLEGYDAEPTATDLLSGPLAYFTSSKVNHKGAFGLAALLGAMKTHEPDFTIAGLIKHTGFSNTRTLHLVELVGGHVRTLDLLLLDCDFPQDQGLSWLQMIAGKKAFGEYQPHSLLKMLDTLIQEIPFFTQNELDHPETLQCSFEQPKPGARSRRDRYFIPAMQQVPGLNAALLAHLETLQGVTPDHLYLVGIEPEDAPKIVQKMPLKVQGKLFSTDLGL